MYRSAVERPNEEPFLFANPPPTQNRQETPSVHSHETNYGETMAAGWYGPRPAQSAPMRPGAYPVPQAQYGTMPFQPQPEPLFVAVNPFDAPSPRWRRPARPAPSNPASDPDAPPAWRTQPVPVVPPTQPFIPVVQPAGYPGQSPYWGRPGTPGWGASAQPFIPVVQPAGYPGQSPYWGRPGTPGWGASAQPATFYRPVAKLEKTRKNTTSHILVYPQAASFQVFQVAQEQWFIPQNI
ncbi:hypothetical protein C8F04DRAFT_1257761 [Mycena alexandri]|uniref:Uncharacterized protein n=1 Tax=Mycena alexandri TaxID=1745969 RepID=A0AAD6SYR4_9AGAR|nr:hypothetical protein C8F04DRAFT_1257761 [Mycena alexandri]